MLNTIIVVIPILLIIVAVEWFISYRHNHTTYTSGNFVMNIAIGAMDQVMSLIYFVALYFTLDFMFAHFRLITFENHWYTWIIAYIVVDFLSYWYHRFSHRVNFLWAGHVTHHSSEHFNFSNGFRTSFFQGINRIIFWSCLPVFGFSPAMLVIILKISGLYDFLLHTKYIPKLGILEKFFVTPSQHRVHHGRNEIYIDKNYGSTFVFWDKLFGTFQEETEEVRYGIKGPYVDNNPFMAVGYYYYYLWHAMKTQQGFFSKAFLLFVPPDRTPKPEIHKLRAICSSQDNAPLHLKQYAWFQITCTVPGLIVMLFCKNFLSVPVLAIYSCIGITGIGLGAMVLNGNVREHLSSIESLRLGFSLVLIFGIYLLTGKLHSVPIAFFLLASFFLLTFLSEKNTLKLRFNRAPSTEHWALPPENPCENQRRTNGRV